MNVGWTKEGVPSRPGRQRRPYWVRVAGWAFALFLIFSFSAGLGLFAFLNGLRGQGTVQGAGLVAEPGPGERVNVLVLGVDSVDGIERSDTLMVFSLDPLTREIALLSVPRDTLVEIPGRPGREKITHAHAYGGPLKSLLTVSAFLGEPIHYYVKVDFKGFASLVDLLGGVTVDVEKPMRYHDPTQDLHIDFAPGRQRLMGQKALEYVRYRSDGDLNRIRRQQAFLQAAADEAFQAGTILKLPRMLGELSRYVETNMTPQEMLSLAQQVAAADRSEIVMGTVPVHAAWTTGARGGEIYLGEEADPRGKADLVGRLLKGVDRTANARVKVSIVNAAADAGAGERVGRLLGALGYAVVGVSESPAGAAAGTAVVYNGGEDRHLLAQVLARSLADALGPVSVYRPAPWRTLFGGGRDAVPEGADLTLIVGRAP